MKPLFVNILLMLFASSSCNTTNEYYETTTPVPDPITLSVSNASLDTVDVWLTLSVFEDSTTASKYVQQVDGIFGMTGSEPFGSFKVAPGDTLSYTPGKAISGNLCFGTQPLNCPNDLWPHATNIFEFALNNNLAPASQETVEISCVSGVNSLMEGYLVGPGWTVTTGIDTVRRFENGPFGDNRKRYGVFPTGCTDCTDQDGAPSCAFPLPFEKPNTSKICLLQRPATIGGGKVYCTFKNYTK